MLTNDNSLEQSLGALERDAEAAVRSLGAALREAKKVKAAAATGQLRELRQALDSAVRLAEAAAVATREVRMGWTFDEQAHFAGGGYTKEVLALAAEEGVQAFESDDRILCYPAIVQVAEEVGQRRGLAPEGGPAARRAASSTSWSSTPARSSSRAPVVAVRANDADTRHLLGPLGLGSVHRHVEQVDTPAAADGVHRPRRHDQVQLVAGEYDRRPGPRLGLENTGQDVDTDRVEAADPLVQHEQLRRGDQRGRALAALLVTERQLLNRLAGAVAEPDRVEDGSSGARCGTGRHTRQPAK